MKYKQVSKHDFSTPGNEATVFEKTSRLGEGKDPSCVYLPVTVVTLDCPGRGGDQDLRMEMEMKIGRSWDCWGVCLRALTCVCVVGGATVEQPGFLGELEANCREERSMGKGKSIPRGAGNLQGRFQV